jgi:hypothetical protein
VDADTGDNAWVSYSLLPSSEFAEQFNMDDETGTFPCYHSLRAVMSDPHCNENPNNVFPEKELRGLSPNFHIHVSVSDLYIPRMRRHIFLQQNRQTDLGNIQYKSLTDT